MLVKWILSLYPSAWRQRYSEEVLAVLEQHQVTWRTLWDLLWGALDARGDPYFRSQARSLLIQKEIPLRSAHPRSETMNEVNSQHSRPAFFVDGTLVGMAIVLALMLFGVVRYPASVSQGGQGYFLITLCVLLAYAGGVVWARQRAGDSVHAALKQGSRIGLFLGSVASANLLIEHFVALNAFWGMVFGVGMWGLMFLSFGAAGSATYQKSGSLSLSVLSSVWSALISTTATLLCGFTLNLVFMSHMQHILAEAYAQSGMNDPQAFVFRNTLDSASSHLILAPLVALFFGLVGASACSILRSIRRSVAVSLGVFELMLFVGGLASIQFASSLERSGRPPYIMSGLLALGVAMACAHAVLTAIRRPPELA